MFLVCCHVICRTVYIGSLSQNKAHQAVSTPPLHIDFAVISALLVEYVLHISLPSKYSVLPLFPHFSSISSLSPCSAFIHEANDPSQQVPLVDSSLQTPVGLALDWLQHNLYWTDSGDKSISVASVDGTKRHVLINTDLSEPRAIALDPHHG